MAEGQELPPPFAMMKMLTGYWVSQIMGAMAQLDVADAIAEGSTSIDAIAARTKSDTAAMERLVRAAASLGVVKRDAEGRISNTPLGETLRANVPGSMHAMAKALTMPGHWLPWGKLADAVRTGENQASATLGSDLFGYYTAHASEEAVFDQAMSNFSGLLAPGIAAAVQLQPGARVADVGGSKGELLGALLTANPGTSGVLLDRAPVVARAKERLATLGLLDRVELVGGDFFVSVPSADVYVMKHILHDWDDARCIQLLANCAHAMRPGGRVMIAELVLPDTDAPGLAPLMDINMMAIVPGKERTQAQYARLFEAAGLKLSRAIATKTPLSVLEATKP
jgi:hypothetical protein